MNKQMKFFLIYLVDSKAWLVLPNTFSHSLIQSSIQQIDVEYQLCAKHTLRILWINLFLFLIKMNLFFFF